MTAASALPYAAALLILLLPAGLYFARAWRRHPAPTEDEMRHVEQQLLTARQELNAACCVCSWVSHGARHDPHCPDHLTGASMDRCDDCGRAYCQDCGGHYCCEPCPCDRSHNCDCECRGHDRRMTYAD